MKKKLAKEDWVVKSEAETQLILRLEFQNEELINFKDCSRKNRRQRLSRKRCQN
jgi:type IV secretory pathway VirB9-like protein